MTVAALKKRLRTAEYDGRTFVTIEGEKWIRQRSGWAKQHAWANDKHASFTLAELGVTS